LLADAGITATALAGPFRDAPDGEDIRILADDSVAPPAGDAALLSTLIAGRIEEPPALGLAHGSGALALNAPRRLLAAQMDAWTRVAIAEEERARRLATAATLGIAAPMPPKPRNFKALYIGAPSSAFLALE